MRFDRSLSARSQILRREILRSTLVLTIQRGFRHRDYAALQHEYNRAFRQLGGVSSLLFDMSQSPRLESVVVEMMVALTHRIRDVDGDAVMCCLDSKSAVSLQSLMMLQPRNKTARWQQFRHRDSALAWLWATVGR
jgi:anti-anti-sigma regulatory factor